MAETVQNQNMAGFFVSSSAFQNWMDEKMCITNHGHPCVVPVVHFWPILSTIWKRRPAMNNLIKHKKNISPTIHGT
jgi:hypothetical protein